VGHVVLTVSNMVDLVIKAVAPWFEEQDWAKNGGKADVSSIGSLFPPFPPDFPPGGSPFWRPTACTTFLSRGCSVALRNERRNACCG
jgi:hypothetical protein